MDRLVNHLLNVYIHLIMYTNVYLQKYGNRYYGFKISNSITYVVSKEIHSNYVESKVSKFVPKKINIGTYIVT